MRVSAHTCILSLLVLVESIVCHAAPATPAPVLDVRRALVVVTFANQPLQSPPPAGTTGRRYAGNTYGVAQTAHQQARRVAATYSLREVASWPIKALAVHCVVYEIPDGRSPAVVVAALAKDPRIALAQPMQQFHTLTEPPQPAGKYNDPLFDLQSNLSTLGIAEAHERSQGAGVRVALIDTAVDSQHPDLYGRIVATHSFVSGHAVPARSTRHGTAMAGLIAAVANNRIGIVGIAPLAKIEVFEACWQLNPDTDEAACNTFTLAQALAAALDARVPLVNLSIAGPADPLLSALVETGVKRGVIFIGAATAAAEAFPTGIQGVIAAGGSEHELSSATIAAPAVHVLTLRPDSQYDFESGTSVAAAEVTGIVALLLGADNHLTTDYVVTLLKETSRTLTAASAAPAINVTAALAKLDADAHRGRTTVLGKHSGSRWNHSRYHPPR